MFVSICDGTRIPPTTWAGTCSRNMIAKRAAGRAAAVTAWGYGFVWTDRPIEPVMQGEYRFWSEAIKQT